MSASVTAPSPPGRAARTRESIIGAGRKLFADRAVDAVAIDDIVREAAVSKGSFYNHFDDKDALVRAIVTEIRAGIEVRVKAANEGVEDPARRLVRGVCVYARFALDEPEGAGVLERMRGGAVSMTSPLNAGLIEDLAAGLAAGRFDFATLDSGVLYVVGVSQTGLSRIALTPLPALAISLAQQLGALILRGLGVPAPEASALAAQAADEIVRRDRRRPGP